MNDTERLARDPAMRAIVGREGIDRPAASTSEIGRFETEWLTTDANLDGCEKTHRQGLDPVLGAAIADGIREMSGIRRKQTKRGFMRTGWVGVCSC